ncbi:unnamed protein product [Caenorhabditis angaria]|uniref:F-box domain-containing protein n=1 Tax=Caenorhabditis angaria TaxID=860376 RepID=A0A9P1I8A1_9PELO|nr:unnamed protein product [Caenorhabditis angaria]
MEPAAKKIKVEDEPDWFDLPYEMRRIIIDYLDIQTKVRFARCSKDCYEEVQLTKYFMYKLTISGSENYTLFHLNNIWSGYKFAISKGAPDPILWDPKRKTIRVKTTEELHQLLLLFFRALMKISRNGLEILEIYKYNFPYNETNVKMLKNLRGIDIYPNLDDNIDPIRCGFIDFEQVCSFDFTVGCPILTIDQIFKIKNARMIFIGYENGEAIDINQLVNRILDGELNGNCEIMRLKPKQSLDTIPGIFARREKSSGYSQYLVKRKDKMILVKNNPLTIDIHTKICPYGINYREWTIL